MHVLLSSSTPHALEPTAYCQYSREQKPGRVQIKALALSALFLASGLTSTPSPAADHLIANLEPGQRVQLNSEIQGVVQQVHANLGDRVEAGAILLQLNRRDYELETELAKAQTALSQAERKASQKQYQRLKTLYKNGSVSDSQWEEAVRNYDVSRAQVLVDQARLDITRQTLSKTALKAPFSGVIASRMTEPGQLLNSGDSAFELVSLNPMKAVFYVLESDYQRIQPGDQLDVELRVNGQRYPAEVTRIAPDQNQSRPGYRVEALLDNAHGQLKPGFSARIWLPDDHGNEDKEVNPIINQDALPSYQGATQTSYKALVKKTESEQEDD